MARMLSARGTALPEVSVPRLIVLQSSLCLLPVWGRLTGRVLRLRSLPSCLLLLLLLRTRPGQYRP